MSSKKKCMILISVLVLLLIVIGVIIYISSDADTTNELLIGNNKESFEDYKEEDTNNKSDADTTNELLIGNNKESFEDYKEEDTNNKSDVDTDNNNDKNDDRDLNISVNDQADDNDIYEYTEEEVVEYFSIIEEEVNESSSFKEKFKEYFILIVDFIFYDREIKGYTFSELSGTAKVKIISMALKMDSKIEEYVPNYKENISSNSSRIYTNVKEKLVTLYMEVSTDICKNNVDECIKVKEIFSNVKDVCSIGWNFIKGLLSNGGSKLKEWYEIYSGK